jgi:hypothetical protein
MQKDPREKVARSRAEHLEKQLARLLIVVDAKTKTPELTITRDGIAVGDAELGNPLPVDPGPHEVTAAAPGRKPWKTSVTIAPRAATTSVTIPPLDPDGTSSKVTPPPPPPPPDDHTTPPPPESTGSTQRLIGLLVAGVGVAGAGVGTYFAFHAKSTYDSSSDGGHCVADNRCDPAGTQRRHDASTQATVATIAIGVGAAAIVAGAVLYFTAPSSRAVKVDGQSLSFRF